MSSGEDLLVERPENVDAFLDAAESLLLADEARHNLMLGIASTLRRRPGLYTEACFWVVRDEGGAVVGAAQRTPPYNLTLAQPADGRALDALAAATEDVPGIVAAVPEVDAFRARWTVHHGGPSHVELEQGIFALERVAELGHATGAMRRAGEGDRPLVEAWLREFNAEALPQETHDEAWFRRVIDQRLHDDLGGFFIWEDGGEAVSFAGAGSRTPNGIRIGPVYTPPPLRGRGYATTLVAELSRLLLDRGRRFCFLYTDLANPTANAIYERIGYVRVCTSRQVSFTRASSGAASSAAPSDARGGA